jgi:hypothetical protein
LAETETKNREISAASLKEKSFCFSAAKRRSAAGTREKRGLQFCLDATRTQRRRRRRGTVSAENKNRKVKRKTSLLC